METDAVALQYGQAYVASRAETTVRCDALTLDLYTENYDAGIVAALDLDFFDLVDFLAFVLLLLFFFKAPPFKLEYCNVEFCNII